MKDVVFTHEAGTDLEAAYSWYEERRTGLGHDFLLQVEAGIELLKIQPLMCQIKYKNVRQYIIKRFPYNIFYIIDGNNTVIIAVLYAGQNPDLIKKRRIDK